MKSFIIFYSKIKYKVGILIFLGVLEENCNQNLF